jgi:hypothetical protein
MIPAAEPPDLFSRLWNFPAPAAPRPGYALAVGPGGFAGWTLTALAPGLAAGGRVLWVDASNRFDLHGLARAAQARGADVRAVLSRVDLARPFTAFQLEKLAASVLPSLPHRRPVVLSDPLPLFYDPDLPLDDAQRLFASFLARIGELERPALVLALQRRPPPERAGFSRRLLAGAKASAVMALDGAWKLSPAALLD